MKLASEYRYYLDNKSELLKKYKDTFIVIKGDDVIGSYPTMEEAVEETKKTHDLGTFLVQHVIEGEEIVQRFYSRVG